MPIDPNIFRTGGILQGEVAASLLRQCAASAELAPGTQIDIYRVLRELGRGGMAIVYLAERADGEYQQQVALKWMQDAVVDASSEALFRRERQALADLRHPHIARLLDGGRSGEGRLWFAMEYIEGEPLDRHCVQAGLALSKRLALFLQVCAAVAFAHARGMIHRDIKPSNVLVDQDGSAKLLDFGIAQLLGQDDPIAVRAFTPGFASPEQMRGASLTVASDVFQLGRLLSSLLSADAGEQAALTTEIAGAAQSGDAFVLPLPRQLTADLQAILRRATATDPAQRYATADALAADVQAFLAHQPVAARPRTAIYVAQRMLRRHPIAVLAALLAVVLIAALTTVFALRVRDERDIAQKERTSAEAINRFLNEDLLDAANPLRRAPNEPEVTVRQALQHASERVDARFGAEPRVAVSVLSTLGTLRWEFGESETALALYDRALQYARLLPEDDRVVLVVMAERANALTSLQRYDEAQPIYAALLPLAERALGPNHESTLAWALASIDANSRQGADVAFRPQYEALAARADRALGQPNAVAGEARLRIAQSLRMSGAPELGAPVAIQAHAELTQSRGPDHPSTLKALTIVGYGLQAQGKDAEAVEAMRGAFELQRARYGPHTTDSQHIQNEYAVVLAALGRHAQAEPLLSELIELRTTRLGAASINLVPPLSNLGNVRLQLGRAAEALLDFDRALAIHDGVPNAPMPMRCIVLRGRADALRELGRYQEAGQTLDNADQVAAALPENDLRRIALQGSRGRLLIAMGQGERGLVLLDAAIAALRAQVTDANPVLKVLLAARAKVGAAGAAPPG